MDSHLITLLKRIATDKNKMTITQLVEVFQRQEKYISQLEMDNFQLTKEVHRVYQYLEGSERTIKDLKRACKTILNKYHERHTN